MEREGGGSFLGDSLGLVALMLHVAETTGQALAVALLAAGRRRPGVPAGVAGRRPRPGGRARPGAGQRRRRVATNGGETLGPLVVAPLLPVLGVRGVLLADAASFLVSAVLLGFLPARAGAGGQAGPRTSFLADAATGLRYLRGQATVRAVVLGYVAVVACTGIDDVARAGNLLTGLPGRSRRPSPCRPSAGSASPPWTSPPPPWPCAAPPADRLGATCSASRPPVAAPASSSAMTARAGLRQAERLRR